MLLHSERAGVGEEALPLFCKDLGERSFLGNAHFMGLES